MNKVCMNDKCKIKWNCKYYNNKYEPIIIINKIKITYKNCYLREELF